MNFILRHVTSENRQSNEILGKNYHLVYDDRKILPNGEFDPNDKTEMLESYLKLLEGYPDNTHEKVHAFIIAEIESNGKLEHRNIPIYKKSKYYIMTESGQTFSTIKPFNNG